MQLQRPFHSYMHMSLRMWTLCTSADCLHYPRFVLEIVIWSHFRGATPALRTMGVLFWSLLGELPTVATLTSLPSEVGGRFRASHTRH